MLANWCLCDCSPTAVRLLLVVQGEIELNEVRPDSVEATLIGMANEESDLDNDATSGIPVTIEVPPTTDPHHSPPPHSPRGNAWSEMY